jgi:hypothetical protein
MMGVVGRLLSACGTAIRLSFVTSQTNNSNTANLTLSGLAQPGDILIYFNASIGAQNIMNKPATIPGFTTLAVNNNQSQDKYAAYFKVVAPGEPGSLVIGHSSGRIGLMVFRPDNPINNVSVDQITHQYTSAKPTDHTITPASATPCLILIMGVGASSAPVIGGTLPRDASSLFGNANFTMHYRISNSLVDSGSVTMNDCGADNILLTTVLKVR